jgi:hypothetical protein
LAYQALVARELGVFPSADFAAGLGIPLARGNGAAGGLVPRARQGAPAG